MALDVATLKAELLKLFDPDDVGFVGYPATIAAAATNLANAYDTYASSAEDVSGDALVSADKATFESILAAQLPAPVVGTLPADAALAFANAFIAYWAGATFAVGSLPPASPPGCPNMGGTTIFSAETTSVAVAVAVGLLADLTTEFAVNTVDPDAKADDLANALHTATTSEVTVLITGLDTTLPVPLPITNTCTVF